MNIEITSNILSFIGIAAFSASGAMTGIERNTDLLGTIILACTTATGGGVLRDLLLGFIPPRIFIHPSYLFIAISVSIFLFCFAYIRYEEYSKGSSFIEKTNNIFDALGLGIFVALGTQTAIDTGYGQNFFLSILIGTITGVGGGFLRDIMVIRMPVILRKHIYASAALLGSSVFFILHILSVKYSYSLILSALTTFITRMLATYYEWDLPKIK